MADLTEQNRILRQNHEPLLSDVISGQPNMEVHHIDSGKPLAEAEV